jgi:hypothetical protein
VLSFVGPLFLVTGSGEGSACPRRAARVALAGRFTQPDKLVSGRPIRPDHDASYASAARLQGDASILTFGFCPCRCHGSSSTLECTLPGDAGQLVPMNRAVLRVFNSVRLCPSQHKSCGDLASHGVLPQCQQQFACQRYDERLLAGTFHTADPLLIPLHKCTFLLELQHSPC